MSLLFGFLGYGRSQAGGQDSRAGWRGPARRWFTGPKHTIDLPADVTSADAVRSAGRAEQGG